MRLLVLVGLLCGLALASFLLGLTVLASQNGWRVTLHFNRYHEGWAEVGVFSFLCLFFLVTLGWWLRKGGA